MAKWFPFIFAGVNITLMFVGLFLVYKATLGHESILITEVLEIPAFDSERENAESNPIVYTMDKFTVNLDGSPRRIIQTEISLEMLDERGFEEVVDLGARARDAVVRILNSKSFDEVETLQGKLFLKDQIATTLNQHMNGGIIKEVYFSEFIIQ